jgi:hypothetical protein
MAAVVNEEAPYLLNLFENLARLGETSRMSVMGRRFEVG